MNGDWTDGFCGAGGSTTGIVVAGGVVRQALNHWELALETHGLNHPGVEHFHTDISNALPQWYKRTEFAWWSPECTKQCWEPSAYR